MESSENDVVSVAVKEYNHVSVVADVDLRVEGADAFLNFVGGVVVFVELLLVLLRLFLAST